jgi:hypothetical protein
MLNDAASEFCSTHCEVTSAPGEDSVDFSAWGVKEMKAFLAEREVDTREFSEKAELAAACRRERLAMMSSGNGRLAQVGKGSSRGRIKEGGTFRRLPSG